MFGQYSQTRKGLVLAAAIASGLISSGLGFPRPLHAQSPDPATQLYVNRIDVAYANVGGPRRLPLAGVDIVDGNGQPVNGALIVGDWSGCFKQLNDSALTETVCHTDEDGTVNCIEGEAVIWANKSYSCWGVGKRCSFTFTIKSVSKEGRTYVPVVGKTTDSAKCL